MPPSAEMPPPPEAAPSPEQPTEKEVKDFIRRDTWGGICLAALEGADIREVNRNIAQVEKEVGDRLRWVEPNDLQQVNKQDRVAIPGSLHPWDQEKQRQLMPPGAQNRVLILVAKGTPLREAMPHIGAVMMERLKSLERVTNIKPGLVGAAREYFWSRRH